MNGRWSVCTSILLGILLVLAFSTGCDVNTPVEPLAGEQSIYTAGGVSFNLRYVPGKTFPTVEDDSGTATVSNGFWIAETEVTYELWSTVYSWATDGARGTSVYSFANTGTMGDGTGDTNQHPVTTINWRDGMVWLNALTEWYNAQNGTAFSCAYYSDAANTTILRDSSDGTYGASINATAGGFDNPYVKAAATGFRLPGRDEWELAARYIDDADQDGILDPGEYYPGSYASGATADYANSAATGAVSVNSVNSGTSTAAVGSKLANALGLFDMSGNVYELCFDWYDATNRVRRGGAYNSSEMNQQLGLVYWLPPYSEGTSFGLRLARNR